MQNTPDVYNESTWLKFLVEQNIKLVDKFNQLVDENQQLLKDNRKLVEYIEDLLVETSESSDSVKESLDSLTDTNKETLNHLSGLIQDSVGQIAYKMVNKQLIKEKEKRVGDKAPAHKKLPVDEIINRYKNGASVQELASSYGVSVPTILDRLKASGVYKDARKKK
jgi:uncharacterized protein (DUF433 family)